MNYPGAGPMRWQPIASAPRDGTVILGRNEAWSEDIRCRYVDGEWQAERLAMRLGPAQHIPDPTLWQSI